LKRLWLCEVIKTQFFKHCLKPAGLTLSEDAVEFKQREVRKDEEDIVSVVSQK
jgi:hypothetical protein